MDAADTGSDVIAEMVSATSDRLTKNVVPLVFRGYDKPTGEQPVVRVFRTMFFSSLRRLPR